MAIDTDYSFLNLPRAGSATRGPIARPSFDPTDFSFNLERYAPQNLPDVEMVAPSLPSLSADENEAVLNDARPFEDIRTLGATFGQKLAETERFFGERVSSLQGNIDELINTKSDLTKQLEAAFLKQDEMSQQAIEERIAALDAQRAELTAQLEQSVAEAEANGVNAVAAAEQVAAEKIATLDQQIAQTSQELQQAVAQQDVIRAEESEKRLAELENQKVTLTEQFTQQQTALQEQFGQREAELTGTIDSLQGEINNLTGARDSAIAERDQAIAQQDTIRAEAADAQAQALDAQANDYQAQLDELTGRSSEYQTELGERDQTIADLQAQIAALQGAEQPPVDTPPPDDTPVVTPVEDGPPLSYQEFIEAGNKPIDYNAYMMSFKDYKPKPPINIDEYGPKPPKMPPPQDFGYGPGIMPPLPPMDIDKGKPKPPSVGGVGGGTYREFEGPGGSVYSVGVKDPIGLPPGFVPGKKPPLFPKPPVFPRPPRKPAVFEKQPKGLARLFGNFAGRMGGR